MDYQDFILQLDRDSRGPGFLTRVIRSPAGEAEEPFVNPVLPKELDDFWWRAHRARQASRERGFRDAGPRRPEEGPLAAELALEELGGRLFRALFQGSVRACWERSLAGSETSSDRGLRLKLQLNVSDPLLTPLAELPWEYLFSPEQGGFLGLQRETPVIRHLRLPLSVGQPPVARPLRVLIVSSQPPSMSLLSLEDEGEKIATALRKLPGVDTLPLPNPTVEELREILLEKQFHVLHFMGHGGFDPESGQGSLFFTDKDGSAVPVSGALLASHLAGLRSLRLVFVNACETARTNDRAPFAGVATALLRAGLPAVIAMQRPIQDESALELSRVVYRRLASGDPIEAAVTEGRLAIARGHGALLEWGTPVLFSRLDEGLLIVPGPPPVSAEPPVAPRPQVPEPQAARPNRPLVAFLGTGVLAAALVVGYFQLPKTMGPKPEPNADSGISMTSEPMTTNPALTTDQADPKKKDKDEDSGMGTAPKVPRKNPPERESRTTSPLAPRPSSSYIVSEGGSATVADLNAEVGANFYERDGHAFARFWVSPPGEGMLQQPPVVGPGPIEFPAQSGTYRLDVLNLDLTQKRASIRLKLLPKSTV